MNDALYFLLGRSTVKVLSDSSTVSVKDHSNTTVATKNVASGIATFTLVPGTYTFTSGTKTASVNVGYKKSMTINMMTENTIAGDTTVVEAMTAANGEPFIFGYDSDTNEYGRVGSDGAFHPFSNARKLYEALQYSGLVTEDMTYNEMLQVLMDTYPAIPIGTSWDFAYQGSSEEFDIPLTAVYKLEVWGAQGGIHGGGSIGGYGGYSVGYVPLAKGQKIYICVGGGGGKSGAGTGGYNGGGSSGHTQGSGGGGATHIATTNRGLLSAYESYKSDVLIVGAGGGGVCRNSGKGGYGGGLTGGIGAGGYYRGRGGTQTAGGANLDGDYGTFGRGGTSHSAKTSQGGGGGAGWYGGAPGLTSDEAGGGGSSYIDGVPELVYKGVTYSPSTTENVNGRTTDSAVAGYNGKAKITLVAM